MESNDEKRKALREELFKSSTCDVCGQPGIAGVAASAFGPVSFAYCYECLNAGAEEWGTITYAVWNGGGVEGCSPHAHDTLRITMSRLGKTEEDLAARLAEIEEVVRRDTFNHYIDWLRDSGFSAFEILSAFSYPKPPTVTEVIVSTAYRMGGTGTGGMQARVLAEHRAWFLDTGEALNWVDTVPDVTGSIVKDYPIVTTNPVAYRGWREASEEGPAPTPSPREKSDDVSEN